MTVSVQTDLPGITIESVARLYAQYDRMNVPDYYEDGEENPFAGRCRVIPKKATYYAMVPAKDRDACLMAAQTLIGLAKRKKVRFVTRTKGEINFNQFAPAGDIVVMWA